MGRRGSHRIRPPWLVRGARAFGMFGNEDIPHNFCKASHPLWCGWIIPMAGRRMLCQTLNAEYARKGVHVVHVIIDGVCVDAWVQGKGIVGWVGGVLCMCPSKLR